MKKKNFSQMLTILICAVLLLTAFPITASADTGPKPSVHITFEGLGEQLCYGTLLSKTESTGPSSAWDGDEEQIYNDNLSMDIWKAFVEYEDTDGFYFLQEGWQINETKELAWTYYPPNEFKILLYFPESNTFAISGIYERYAFDSYFTVNMQGIAIDTVNYDEEQSNNERIDAYKSYNYKREIIALIIRIIITIMIEMVIALLFGYKEKRQLLLLIGVNTATQIILNVLLNIINYNSGQTAFVIYYILFELIVFAIEAVVFYNFLAKTSIKQNPKWLTVIYALVANSVSFISGLYLSEWLPSLF